MKKLIVTLTALFAAAAVTFGFAPAAQASTGPVGWYTMGYYSHTYTWSNGSPAVQVNVAMSVFHGCSICDITYIKGTATVHNMSPGKITRVTVADVRLIRDPAAAVTANYTDVSSSSQAHSETGSYTVSEGGNWQYFGAVTVTWLDASGATGVGKDNSNRSPGWFNP